MRFLFAPVLMLLIISSLHSQSNLLTARQHFEALNAQVTANHDADTRLFLVMALYQFAGYPMTLDLDSGKADLWIYGYLSAKEQTMITAVATESELLGTMIGEVGAEAWPEGSDSLYVRLTNGWWINSDSAAAVWKTTAMRGFLDSRPSALLVGFGMSPGKNITLEWAVMAVDGTDTLSCSIDALTAEALECISSTPVEEINSAKDFALGEVYPNPVRSGAFAEINLTPSTPGNISIEVFDAMGRQQGYVLDEHVSPGTRKVIIPAGLLSRPGIYFIQARSQSGIVTRKLIVTR